MDSPVRVVLNADQGSGPLPSPASHKRKAEGEPWGPPTAEISSFAASPMSACDAEDLIGPSPEGCAAAKAPRLRAMTATASLLAGLASCGSDATVNDNIDAEDAGPADGIASACSALTLCGGAAVPPSAAWADLPDDVLRRILDNLPCYSLRVVRTTCRGWRAAVNRSLCFARPEAIPPAGRLAFHFPNLRVLDLSCAEGALELGAGPAGLAMRSGLTDDALSALAGLDRLQELSLRGCSRLQGPGLAHLAALPALEHVDLTGCGGLSDAGFAAGASGLVGVSAVTLLSCWRLGDVAVGVMASLPRLQRAAVPPRTTDAGLHALATAPALQRVAIRGCAGVGPEGIAALLQAPHLKRVVVSRCPQVTAAALGEVAPLLSVVSRAVHAGPYIPPQQQPQGTQDQAEQQQLLVQQPQAAAGAGALVPPLLAPQTDLQLLLATFHN